MTAQTNEKRKRLIAQALLAGGLMLVGTAVFNMTLGDQLAGEQQQKQAESVPLKFDAPATAADSKLQVGEVFAKLYVPRFGQNYVREIAEGVSLEKVLNTVGIGHYIGSAMPGEVGNFAIAGHRAGNGGPMRDIDKLVAGDQAIVETATQKFTYEFLELKIVKPSEVGVLAADPVGLTIKDPNGQYLTLTSCTPIHVNTDRIVAWFKLLSVTANNG